VGVAGEFRQHAAPIWDAARNHPFVRGIGDGSLPPEKFKFYIRQDYAFLVEFSRVLALAAARSAELESMSRYSHLLHETLHTEMELHRAYCERFGIVRSELEATEAAPTTYAYTRHLLAVAYSGDLAGITASLIPCQLGYAEIGRELAEQGEPKSQPLYSDWIRMYASPEVQEIAEWSCALLDRVAAGAQSQAHDRLREIYVTSSRYEFMFWEMADKMERWPV
jgi:thiaminase (transcriptional activator TenA)